MEKDYLLLKGAVISKASSTRCASNAPSDRKGRYSVRRLIEKYGRKANMVKWKERLNGDCPNRDTHSTLKRCDLICPVPPQSADRGASKLRPSSSVVIAERTGAAA
jgi:hypothetical protein